MKLQDYQKISNQQNLELGLYTAAVDTCFGETHILLTGSIRTAVAYCNKHYQQNDFGGCRIFNPAGEEILNMDEEFDELNSFDSSIIPILQEQFPAAAEKISK